MKISLRWVISITLFLLMLTPPSSFGGTAPLCPTCGRQPQCPPDAPPDAPCNNPPATQREPAPAPTPNPAPAPSSPQPNPAPKK